MGSYTWFYFIYLFSGKENVNSDGKNKRIALTSKWVEGMFVTYPSLMGPIEVYIHATTKGTKGTARSNSTPMLKYKLISCVYQFIWIEPWNKVNFVTSPQIQANNAKNVVKLVVSKI
jgi:hypothetical protein